jgi:hypothetical protein
MNATEEFFRAVIQGRIDDAETARKSGAEVDASDPRTGLTPLNAAISTDNPAMTRFVLANCNARLAKDAHGRSPLALAEYFAGADTLDQVRAAAEKQAGWEKAVRKAAEAETSRPKEPHPGREFPF